MKTQEEYAREIDEIVRRDVESCQSDWFKIDKEIFMQPKNKNKIFILGTRKTGCDLIILGGTKWSINRYENDILTAGCHRIAYSEMESIAKQLGWA